MVHRHKLFPTLSLVSVLEWSTSASHPTRVEDWLPPEQGRELLACQLRRFAYLGHFLPYDYGVLAYLGSTSYGYRDRYQGYMVPIWISELRYHNAFPSQGYGIVRFRGFRSWYCSVRGFGSGKRVMSLA